MSTTHAAPEDHQPGRYEIRVKGHLDARWAAWFDGLSISHESDGTPSSQVRLPTRPRYMACCGKCVISAYRWSRSHASNPTTLDGSTSEPR